MDIDTNDDFYDTSLDTGITTQVSAVGDTFRGIVGKVSKATVGARNSGSSIIRTLTGVDPGLRGTIGVTGGFPGSVKVVIMPKACKILAPTAGGQPFSGASPDGKITAYECVTTTPLDPGKSVYFTFGIRPLKAFSNEFAGVFTDAIEDPNADPDLLTTKLYLSAARA
ncbi:hypothetical protein GXW82_31010 [Streptacidiphilus sp. 4-A2]|nr:hypothetical protein [Streptacidiphilus sp. 4-A2]